MLKTVVFRQKKEGFKIHPSRKVASDKFYVFFQTSFSIPPPFATQASFHPTTLSYSHFFLEIPQFL